MRRYSFGVRGFVVAFVTFAILLLTLLFSPALGQEESGVAPSDVSNAVPSPALPAIDKAIDPDGIQRLVAASGGRAQISLNRATGAVSFVHLRGDALSALGGGTSAEAEAAAFFAEYGSIFGIKEASVELVLLQEQSDKVGMTHLTYQQVYEGVEVFAGIVRVHLNASNRITAVNGAFIPDIALNPMPTLSAEAASTIAVNAVLEQKGLNNVSTDVAVVGSNVYVFRAGLVQGVAGGNHLVYSVEVANSERSIREFVYVDAHNGKIVDQITGVHEALDREVSEGSLANVIWSEGDPDPIPAGWAGGTAQQVTDWNNEIDGARETYNLFASMTNGGWLSFNGVDGTMRTVNNDPGINCPNANWNGTSTNYCSDVTGDDTVAHEWGHAYTEYTHNLIYQWQSGALNESYSDIWGEVVDFLNGRGLDVPGGLRAANGSACSTFGSGSPSTDNTYRWLSGEDDPAFGGAIRDMWRPECYGDPGRVSSPSYTCSTADGGGVHTNSGVPNHGFALAVDGGTYNGQTITGIGLTKAAHIYWRAGSVYQTPSSDFNDHANALAASCSDLIGDPLYALSTSSPTGVISGEVISQADCNELDKVIAAVELQNEPVQCNFEPLLDPNAPPLCTEGNVNSISLTDWESGLGSWTVGTRDVANPASFDTPDWAVVGSLPDGRPGSAAFVQDIAGLGACTPADTEAGVLFLESPVINIPAGVSVPRLAMNHWVATELGWDGGNVKIKVNGGAWTLVPAAAFEFNDYPSNLNGGANDNPMAGEPAFTGTDGGSVGGSWGQSQINLSGLAGAGDTIQLRMEMGLDGCNGVIGWYVDEVEVYACSAGQAPQIGVAPGNLASTQTTDSVVTKTLTISNLGQDDLTWTIDEVEPLVLPAADMSLPNSNMERQPGVTPPATDQAFVPTGAIVQDGSFEAGTPNPVWNEFSTNFGTPLCDANCGGPPAHTGNWHAWFGGIAAAEQGSVDQDVTIPTGTATLSFWLLMGATPGASGSLEVSLDSTPIFTVTQDDVADYDVYTQVTIDVSAFADGGVHTLLFNGEEGAGATLNFFVDDVAIDVEAPGLCDTPGDIPWLTVSPGNGTTAGSSNSLVDVVFDSTGLAIGVYTGTLCIDSNDPVAPQVEVPVTLTVGEEVPNFIIYLPVVVKSD
jgi:Zn-dependent metalloprotease